MKLVSVGLVLILCAGMAQADISGLVDLRLVQGDGTRSWLYEGLGKQRFDGSDDGLQLGQAVVEVKSELTDTLSGKLVVNGYSDRNSFADVTEAYLQWKPLPIDGYRFKAKVGALFPTLSLENSGPGWTNPWMISNSAINTWVGEELRTLGSEVSFSRPGQLNGSAHDIELVGALYRANDPAGALLTWRGWSLGDRITGLTERLTLPDLPVYETGGQLAWQANWEEPFHEIDNRYGYYTGINYGYNGWLNLRALHYDNRGNPRVLQNGQYAWTTRFDHLALRVDFPQELTLMAQYMTGYTQMGRAVRGAIIDFDARYLLLSKAFGRQRLSLRYDKFSTTDEDYTLGDNNAEDGHAIAIAWLFNLNESSQLGSEYLAVSSQRPGRLYLDYTGNNPDAGNWLRETSLQVFYRYKF